VEETGVKKYLYVEMRKAAAVLALMSDSFLPNVRN